MARVYSITSATPSQEYLDEALMRGISRDQAVSTWEHYFGAGLPGHGIERLTDWLCKRAKERQSQLAKLEKSQGNSREKPKKPKEVPIGEALKRRW